MYLKACTCRAVVLLIKPFFFKNLWRCRRRCGCLSSFLTVNDEHRGFQNEKSVRSALISRKKILKTKNFPTSILFCLYWFFSSSLVRSRKKILFIRKKIVGRMRWKNPASDWCLLFLALVFFIRIYHYFVEWILKDHKIVDNSAIAECYTHA